MFYSQTKYDNTGYFYYYLLNLIILSWIVCVDIYIYLFI